MRTQSLKAQLALAFGAITLILTVIFGLIIGQTTIQPEVDPAMLSARTLQYQILVAGSLISLLSVGLGWIVAGRIARPLLMLTKAAQQIRHGDMTAHLPVVPSYHEAHVLSQSLSTMVRDLIQHDVELRSLNAWLEQRVQERTEALMRTNEELKTQIAERQRMEHERELLIRQLKLLAETDALTGLLNRRAFFSLAEREIKRISRHGQPISIVMFDIDRFKQINDTYGHAIGDQVLQSIARCCQSLARESDILGRYGGEEFVLLVQEADEELAQTIAERLRAGIMQARIPCESGELSVTASFGVAATHVPISDIALLLNQADTALYKAKRTGRNRVVVYQPPEARLVEGTPFDGVGRS